MNEAFMFAIASSFFLGLRHGFDWDHLAAIMDIVGTKSSQSIQSHLSLRQAQSATIALAAIYALGHAAIVIFLGVAALNFAMILPAWLDPIMERIVGLSLVILGLWVFYSLWRYLQNREKFYLVSRWMLIFAALKYFANWLANKCFKQNKTPSLTIDKYGPLAAFFIGILHGIGAETGTQILLITAVGAAAHAAGISMLFAFTAGLLISNLLLAVMGSCGFIYTQNLVPAFVASSALAAAFSLVVGTFFITGQVDNLPDLQIIFSAAKKKISYHHANIQTDVRIALDYLNVTH